jgi:hypothetical protein
MKTWGQARSHWDFVAELSLKAAETREEDHIEAATAQMEIERVILASNRQESLKTLKYHRVIEAANK